MLPVNREFHFVGELTLAKSGLLSNVNAPIKDLVNWLFLATNNHMYSFVYKIEDVVNAEYNVPFKISMAFLMADTVKGLVKLGIPYEVYRGLEKVGSVSLISVLQS